MFVNLGLGLLCFSYLRVNDQATVIPCRYRSGSSTSVPVLWVSEGKGLFGFFSTEFDRMWEDAHTVGGGPRRSVQTQGASSAGELSLEAS